MAGRKVFTSGEILTAADVNSFLMDQSVMVFADSTARSSAIPSPSEGMVTYLKDDDEVTVFDGSAFKAVGPGKILQVVRATDSTSRSTTSGSYVDVTGMSVTITPTSSSNNIIIIASFAAASNNGFIAFQITDSSDTAISGQEENLFAESSGRNQFFGLSLIAYDSPATTSAETYKLRFRQAEGGTTTTVRNNLVTGQMFAIEVAA